MTKRVHTVLLIVASALAGIPAPAIWFSCFVLMGGQLPPKGSPDERWVVDVCLAITGAIFGLISGLPTGMLVRSLGPEQKSRELSLGCALIGGLLGAVLLRAGLMLYAAGHSWAFKHSFR
jgi:hypothetical protein